MELSSISDTSLKTPSAHPSSTPTPTRQQTFEPTSSGLRTWVHPAEGPLDERIQGSSVREPVSLKQEQHLNSADATYQPADTSQTQTVTAFSTGGLSNQAAQSWFTQSQISADPAYHPSSNRNANASAQSAHPGSVQPSSIPQYENSGLQGSDIPTPETNAAMLNGMYGLLSGNIYNLQLPEYQQWLHTVSQNQQPGITAFAAHPAVTDLGTAQANLGPFQPVPTPGSNGQWNNFDFGIDLNVAPDVNGAMADIWSMAPNNFEYVSLISQRKGT